LLAGGVPKRPEVMINRNAVKLDIEAKREVNNLDKVELFVAEIGARKSD